MSVVLADLGGTHLRLAMLGAEGDVMRMRIADHPGITGLLRDFCPGMDQLYLASAIHPRDGVIEDRRFQDAAHWRIDLVELQENFPLKRLIVLNDLEAACHGLSSLNGEQLQTLLFPSLDRPHLEHPPKLLVGIGTGIGHAYLFEKPGCPRIVQRSHGGHMPALAVTKEQKDIVASLADRHMPARDAIVENIVSGTGLAALRGSVDADSALRLFWEFLGLYCNVLVSAAGAYGGIYLTGGVMDELVAAGQVDAGALRRGFLRPMVPVVTESLSSTAIYYVREKHLPISGLAAFARTA